MMRVPLQLMLSEVGGVRKGVGSSANFHAAILKVKIKPKPRASFLCVLCPLVTFIHFNWLNCRSAFKASLNQLREALSQSEVKDVVLLFCGLWSLTNYFEVSVDVLINC